MRKMISYRPGEDDLDWEDNAVSNSLAYLSRKVLPGWCNSETHWTFIIADKLWAECSCCHFFRGVFVGGCAGVCLALLLTAILLQFS